MDELIKYVRDHAERGPCCCPACCEAAENPQARAPDGHTADLIFLKVSAKNGADAATFRRLVADNKEGEFGDVDVLDGRPHSYVQIGGWIGSQGLALMLMGLGSVLGVWRLSTPRTVLGEEISHEQAVQMAGSGLLTVQAGPTI